MPPTYTKAVDICEQSFFVEAERTVRNSPMAGR